MKTKEEIEHMLKLKRNFLYSERVEDIKPLTLGETRYTEGWVSALTWVLNDK